MIELFSLGAKINLDKSGFDAGVNDASEKAKALSEDLSSAAGGGTAAGTSLGTLGDIANKAAPMIAGLAVAGTVAKGMFDLADASAKVGDEIDKHSQYLGFTREQYQEWDHVMQINGGTVDGLARSMRSMRTAVAGASDDTVEALDAIGLSLEDLDGLDTEQMFTKIATAFQELSGMNGADKQTLVEKIFGASSKELMPLLNSEVGTIDQLKQEAHDLGIVLSDDVVDSGVKFTDSMTRLNEATEALMTKFGAFAADVIVPMIDWATGAVAWLNENIFHTKSDAEIARDNAQLAARQFLRGEINANTLQDELNNAGLEVDIGLMGLQGKSLPDYLQTVLDGSAFEADVKLVPDYSNMPSFYSGSSAEGSNATGLDYVPYDNFRTRLHAGEAILKRQDAEEWRSGRKGSAAIDYDRMGQVVAAAVGRLTVQMDRRTVGQMVAGVVDTELSKNLRFAR